jgi:hypothetical protein
VCYTASNPKAFKSNIVPSPAGPITIDITKEGIVGKLTLKTNVTINHKPNPNIELIINFFKKKIMNIVIPISISPIIINIGSVGIIDVTSSTGTKSRSFAKFNNCKNIIIL